MLRKLDRIILRVPQLEAAVRYYRDVLGMKLVRQENSVANFALDGATELVLHADPDQPSEAIYFLVDDVRDLSERRESLRLTFVNPPTRVTRGYRAIVKDPFGTLLMLLDRTLGTSGDPKGIEDAKAAGGLFPGLLTRVAANRQLLIQLYQQIGRTADDLPYTPHFESLYEPYAGSMPAPKPDRAEVWRHLLNLRKAGKLPKLGEARSRPPDVEPEVRQRLREILGQDIGKRDRLPYTPRFDRLVDDFNKTLPRKLSPHLIWRLVATLAK
jgi:catechol 2,3-dioxygenase-like lactoylglutathione lyase family enzyme